MDDDTLLTGLVDGELDEADRAALQARLDSEPALRARLAALKAASPLFAPAFDSLLSQAPLDRLKAGISAAPEPALPRRAKLPLALAAGVAALLFVAGFSLARLAPGFGPQMGGDDWRDAVADYAALYTPATFAGAPAPDAAQAAQLARLGAALGVDLSPERLQVDGPPLKAALELAYDGAPLGQIAYAGPEEAPILFCIIANAAADAGRTNAQHDGFALSSWARGGKAYMVIGRRTPEQIAAIADQLSQRF